MLSPLARTREATGRRPSREQERPIESWVPPPLRRDWVHVVAQWQHSTEWSVLLWLFQEGRQVWVSKQALSSDDVTMAGEAGVVGVAPWQADKLGI